MGIEDDVPDVRVVAHGEDGEIDAIVEPVRMIWFGCEGLVDEVGQRLGWVGNLGPSWRLINKSCGGPEEGSEAFNNGRKLNFLTEIFMIDCVTQGFSNFFEPRPFSGYFEFYATLDFYEVQWTFGKRPILVYFGDPKIVFCDP